MKLLPHLLTKNNPEKVGDAPRQFVRICRSFILSFVLPLFSIPLTHSLTHSLPRRALARVAHIASLAPLPAELLHLNVIPNTRGIAAQLALWICSHLSSSSSTPLRLALLLCWILDSCYRNPFAWTNSKEKYLFFNDMTSRDNDVWRVFTPNKSVIWRFSFP